MRLCFAFLLISSLSYLAKAQNNFKQLLTTSKVTGAQIAFTNNGKTTFYNIGLANTDDKLKVTDQTIFQAASLSKVVLAYICLELVAKHQIDLDEPLLNYYDYPRLKNDTNAKKITARMVLKHSSGLPNWAENPLQKSWATSALQTQFIPGTQWQYAGEGYVFLQLAIQNILQKDLQSIAEEMVFKPLGMKNSAFVWQDDFENTAAYGHNEKGEQTESAQFFLPNAGFSLLTTAKDYTLFLSALLKKHLNTMLSDSISVANPLKPNANAKFISWGLGLGIQQNELGTSVWHWGDNGDFKAFFMVYPAKNQILVCFTNSANGLNLMEPLFNTFFGKATWYSKKWLDETH